MIFPGKHINSSYFVFFSGLFCVLFASFLRLSCVFFSSFFVFFSSFFVFFSSFSRLFSSFFPSFFHLFFVFFCLFFFCFFSSFFRPFSGFFRLFCIFCLFVLVHHNLRTSQVILVIRGFLQCYMLGWDGWIGLIIQVIGLLRAPSVLIMKILGNTLFCAHLRG